MSETYLCGGCGIELQTEDKEALGYVPASSLKNEDVLCKRCFQLKHYNKHTTVSLTEDDFLTMVSSISNTKGLVVHLVDLYDVNGTLINYLSRIVGDKQIILVGNNVDILTKRSEERRVGK